MKIAWFVVQLILLIVYDYGFRGLGEMQGETAKIATSMTRSNAVDEGRDKGKRGEVEAAGDEDE